LGQKPASEEKREPAYGQGGKEGEREEKKK